MSTSGRRMKENNSRINNNSNGKEKKKSKKKSCPAKYAGILSSMMNPGFACAVRNADGKAAGII